MSLGIRRDNGWTGSDDTDESKFKIVGEGGGWDRHRPERIDVRVEDNLKRSTVVESRPRPTDKEGRRGSSVDHPQW